MVTLPIEGRWSIKSLSDDDAAALRQKIAEALAERFGAVLRSA